MAIYNETITDSSVEAKVGHAVFDEIELMYYHYPTKPVINIGFASVITELLNATDFIPEGPRQGLSTIVENVLSQDTAFYTFKGFSTLSEHLFVTDNNYVTAVLSLIEQLNIDSNISTIQKVYPYVVDYLLANSQITSHVKFTAKLIEQLLIVEKIALLVGMSLSESIQASDNIAALLRVYEYITENLNDVDAVADSGRFGIILSETLVDLDQLTTTQIVQLFLRSDVYVRGSFVDGESDYTFTINTESMGLTEYSNFGFNSMSEDYVATDSGIYAITNTDDDGVAIDAKIKTGLLDFGTSIQKQVPYAYLGISKKGEMVLKTIVDWKGERKERWYNITMSGVDAVDTKRVALGKGIKSKYWQFELSNKDGSDFDLDVFEVLPLILKRRI